MDQDEEMDTSPLAKPFFTIDKEGDADGVGEGKQEEEVGDSGEEEEPDRQGEEPDRQGEEQEDEEDDDVSVTQKTSNDVRIESGATNGNHGAESEESSDEEEEEQEEANKRLCVAPAAARCQTVTS